MKTQYFLNELSVGVQGDCVFIVLKLCSSIPSFSYSSPEFYPPITSPSLLSTFIVPEIRFNRGLIVIV